MNLCSDGKSGWDEVEVERASNDVKDRQREMRGVFGLLVVAGVVMILVGVFLLVTGELPSLLSFLLTLMADMSAAGGTGSKGRVVV